MPARRRSPQPDPILTAADYERAILRHDLEVHQEELRTQNEKLVTTLQELQEARDRYVELYDAAPSGYCTLDRNGAIVEVNLTAVAILGRPRAVLIGAPLIPAVAPDDRQRFLAYLRHCARGEDDVIAGEEVQFATPRGDTLVRLTCRVRRLPDGGAPEYLLGLQDVTERRRLENAREEAQRAHADLVRRVLTAQEAERHRIAQDIHDDLGQQVTALRLRLEWLASVLAPHPELRNALAQVQESAKKVDQHIDFLLKDLRPAGLEELGLVAVLRKTIEEWSSTFGVRARFRSSGLGGVRFPREIETQVFRIVQEALNNVHKHAAASVVDVVLERRQGRTTLCVEDDGIGLPAHPESSGSTTLGRRGLGLLGMRERAAVIGGALEITAGRSGGTKITLFLPDLPGASA